MSHMPIQRAEFSRAFDEPLPDECFKLVSPMVVRNCYLLDEMFCFMCSKSGCLPRVGKSASKYGEFSPSKSIEGTYSYLRRSGIGNENAYPSSTDQCRRCEGLW